jgi:hypothetical protein
MFSAWETFLQHPVNKYLSASRTVILNAAECAAIGGKTWSKTVLKVESKTTVTSMW